MCRKKLLGVINVYSKVAKQIFCTHQILEEKGKYNGTVYHLYRFQTAYNSGASWHRSVSIVTGQRLAGCKRFFSSPQHPRLALGTTKPPLGSLPGCKAAIQNDLE
jgi:hypothetical protein